MNEGSITHITTSPSRAQSRDTGRTDHTTRPQALDGWIPTCEESKNGIIIKHLLTNQFTGNMIGDSIHEDTHRLYYNIPSVLPPIFK